MAVHDDDVMNLLRARKVLLESVPNVQLDVSVHSVIRRPSHSTFDGCQPASRVPLGRMTPVFSAWAKAKGVVTQHYVESRIRFLARKAWHNRD
jgi:hypothetical protein